MLMVTYGTIATFLTSRTELPNNHMIWNTCEKSVCIYLDTKKCRKQNVTYFIAENLNALDTLLSRKNQML